MISAGGLKKATGNSEFLEHGLIIKQSSKMYQWGLISPLPEGGPFKFVHISWSSCS